MYQRDRKLINHVNWKRIYNELSMQQKKHNKKTKDWPRKPTPKSRVVKG